MAAVDDFTAGGYRFIPGGFQFSGGVAAATGYEIKRFRFRAPVPLMEGFARIEKTVMGAGRPLTAFCACELRSPGQFTEQGFRAFNESYVVTLSKWGVFDGKVNPVARSNVCPEIDPPTEPSFHAFSFTMPAAVGAPSFVISGRAEAREGEASYRERIVRFGETGDDAMHEKARYVMDEVTARLALLGRRLARRHRDPGLHDPRHLSLHGGRDHPPRRRAHRRDLALHPPAGARPRVRGRLPQRARGGSDLGRRVTTCRGWAKAPLGAVPTRGFRRGHASLCPPYMIPSASRRLSISEARSRNARARAGSSAVRRSSS